MTDRGPALLAEIRPRWQALQALPAIYPKRAPAAHAQLTAERDRLTTEIAVRSRAYVALPGQAMVIVSETIAKKD